jgi:hypothetical protein
MLLTYFSTIPGQKWSQKNDFRERTISRKSDREKTIFAKNWTDADCPLPLGVSVEEEEEEEEEEFCLWPIFVCREIAIAK